MMAPAMSFSKGHKLALILALAPIVIGPAPLLAQVMPEPDVTEVAKTPLRDLNIDPKDIPEPLRVAVESPYETARLKNCNVIRADIAELDRVLGADYDIAEDDGNDRFSEGRVGQSVVGSIIPFRSVVREATGAASNERALRAAYTAGMVRRAFLKGVGLGRGCKYPARPRPAAKPGK
jgi:hypothetical protein